MADVSSPQPELPAAPEAQVPVEKSVVEERDALRRAVSAGKFDTLQERVAWILNHYPKARNSDLTLQLAYWETFESDLAGHDYILKADLYKLRRLTSISRARAKIQNTYQLFLASPDVRKRRGTLSEEEREKALEEQPSYPVFAVWADESGKTGKQLIVGSVWFLHPPELFSFIRDVELWRKTNGFTDEFHFKTITSAKLPSYFSFADFLAEKSSVISFKAISVERSGIGNADEGLGLLYYLLLVRGVEHEHSSGRAPLPRGIILWKDLQEPGKDKLFLAQLKEKLGVASATLFQGQLFVEDMEPVDSRGQVLVQVADLFTSSINRVLNAEGAREGAKDRFADYLLERLALPKGPAEEEKNGDITIHISL
jgi:hypothetical protein